MSNRNQLRRATQAAHACVDQTFGEMGIFESLASYRLYLQVMLSLHQECAGSVARIEQDANLTRSLPGLGQLLADDLASTASRVAIKPSPTTDRMTKPLAADWGRAYVVEGSSMGGRFLAKAAAKELPAEVSHRYLDQLAADSQTRWPAFVAALDANEALDVELACQAANDVFRFVGEQIKTLRQTLPA